MEERRAELSCRVCGDKASGKHYGVPSCDGCRGFFKRSIRRCRQNLEYVCKENGRCIVDVARRNQCQACRFSKCLHVNMRREAVQHERAPRSCVKRQQSSLLLADPPFMMSSSVFPPFGSYPAPFPAFRPFPLVPPPFLSSYTGSAFTPIRPTSAAWFMAEPVAARAPAPAPAPAERLAAAAPAADQPARRHDEAEVSSSQIDVVRVDSPGQEHVGSPLSAARSSHSTMMSRPPEIRHVPEARQVTSEVRAAEQPLLATRRSESVLETAAKLLFLAVRWAHTIPSFVQMSGSEQRTLLEASWSELFVISAAQWPLIINSPADLAAASGSLQQQELESQLTAFADIIQRFSDLKVDHTEYACLRALVLFKPEVRSVRDPKYMEILQDQTHLMLYEYVFSQKAAAKARFGRLLLLLSSLRVVSGPFLQEVFFKPALGGVPVGQLLADLNRNTAAI